MSNQQEGFFDFMGLLIHWIKELEEIVIDLKTKPNKKCFLETSVNSHYVIEDEFLIVRADKATAIKESLNLIQDLFECNKPEDFIQHIDFFLQK